MKKDANDSDNESFSYKIILLNVLHTEWRYVSVFDDNSSQEREIFRSSSLL